jgi:Protein of unknown function (DUF4058)
LKKARSSGVREISPSVQPAPAVSFGRLIGAIIRSKAKAWVKMAVIQSIKNQYLGINAHLHSTLQANNDWSNFHSGQITYLVAALITKLRNMGYTAVAEESLQIRRLDSPESRQPRADAAIYDLDPVRSFQPTRAPAQSLMTVAEALYEEELDEKPYKAVAIYPRLEESRGEPVAWIELLSPTNKGDSNDANEYRFKRRQVLNGGLVFVEIDYLNETPPTLPTASPIFPYRIIVLDPRPDLDTGPAEFAEFHVDEPIPTVKIPLNAGDVLNFDFNAPYQKMFEEYFFGDNVDYRQFPAHFERYPQADQQRIACRMLAILKAGREGLDLESAAPLNAEMLPLEDALEEIKRVGRELS